MGALGWVCFGFFAGLLARAILPGEQKMGLIKTTLLGVAGSFLGGSIQALATGGDPLQLQATGFIGAVLGAMAVLVVYGLVFGGKKKAE